MCGDGSGIRRLRSIPTDNAGAVRSRVVWMGDHNIQAESERIQQQDFVKEYHGVRIAVDKKSAEILGGTEIDFKEDLMSRSFVFNNPLAVRTCGCGNSFQA